MTVKETHRDAKSKVAQTPIFAPNKNWLSGLPRGWQVKRGRFVFDVNPPSRLLRTLPVDVDVSFVPMEAIGEYGGLDLNQTRSILDAGSGYSEFEDGDVVVAKITPCFENGKGALADGLCNGAAFGTTELHVLRAKPDLDRRFLFYFTISQSFRTDGEGEMYGAGGQKRIPPGYCKNVLVPLPPIGQQRAIAEFLDRETAKIDVLVAKKRTLIERLREKRAALVSHTVTRGLPPDAARAAGLSPWPKLKSSGIGWLGEVPIHWAVLRLRHVAIVLDCKHRTVSFVSDGVPLASIREVHGFRVDLSNAKQTTEEEYLEMIEGGRAPRIGDIIYSRNATVGDAALVNTAQRFCMGQDVCLIRAPSQNSRYLLYVLRSTSVLEQVESLMIGSTFRRINVGQIKDFWISLPGRLEQDAIADFLDRETGKLDAMVARVESVIERMQEYRSALIAAAISGKFDVRGPTV